MKIDPEAFSSSHSDAAIEAEYLAWEWTAGQGIAGLRCARKALAQPNAGEILVRNQAIGLNPVDWKVVENGHSAWQTGHVPGVDGMGVVVAAGAGVPIRLGTRVAYHQSLEREGSFAEYVRVDASSVLLIPDALDAASAAALPCPGLTAWQAIEKIPVKVDCDVLIVGGGGAVGLLLVQLAVARGFRVWVTAARTHHAQLTTLGAAGVYDYRTDDWRQQLTIQLGERRIYAAFDTVSRASAAKLSPLLGYNGHLVCIQDRQETAPLPPFSTAISLHEVALNSFHQHAGHHDKVLLRQSGEALLGAVLDGRLVLPTINLFTFDKLPVALTQLSAGQAGGKLICLIRH